MSMAPSAPELLAPRLRASVVGATIAAHLCLVAALGLSVSPPQVLAPLNIEMIPQGDYFVDTAQAAGEAEQPPSQQQAPPPEEIAEAEPVEAPKDQAKTLPEAAAQLVPATVAPDAELQAQQRDAEAKDRAEAQEKAEEKAREQRRLERQRERRKQKLLAQAREARAGGGSQAHRAGRRDGQATAQGAAANYSLRVAAELNRHKTYPAAAKARGETGTVGASFTVGPSGRIVAQRITRSSGSSALDGAVRAMMASAHAPPPPGGAFHGSIAIHFNLSR